MNRPRFEESTARTPNPLLSGGTHVGLVWRLTPDGLAVLFDLGWGFCHQAAIAPGIDWARLAVETRVEVRVIGEPNAFLLPLALLSVLDDRTTDGKPANSETILATPSPEERLGAAARTGGAGALIGDNLNYSRELDAALKRGVSSINGVGRQYRNNTRASRAGYVAEADHTATFNVDASFQRKSVRAERPASQEPKSADIEIKRPSGEVVKKASSKVYKKPTDTADKQRGYDNQDRLVPKDQIEEVKSYSAKRATSEASKPGPNRQSVAEQYTEVAQKATDRLSHDQVSSTPRTRSESQEIGDKAAKGNVTGADIVGPVGTRIRQGAAQGAKSGALGGVAFATVAEGLDAFRSVQRGEKSAAEAAGDFASNVFLAAAEGALKGAVSGAATAGARVLAESVTNSTAKAVLGGAGPAAVAVMTVDCAISAVGYARGVKTGVEFRRSVIGTVGAGAGGLVGAKVGFALGEALDVGWLGAIFGGIAGSLLGGFVAGQVSDALEGETAEPDGPCLALGGSVVAHDLLLGSPIDSGSLLRPTFDGAMAFRMAQFNRLLNALKTGSSLVYPGRVLLMPNRYQLTADLLLAHEGHIHAVDFKAWKGVLSDSEDGQRQGGEPRHIFKTRFGKDGNPSVQRLRNPIQDLTRFSNMVRRQLSTQDARWRDYEIRPFVVYPDTETSKAGALRNDSRFLPFSSFMAYLNTLGGGATHGWMQDGLSSIPTWDMVQDRLGVVYEGLIVSPSFTLHMADGSTEIPYAAIIKLEIEHGIDQHVARVSFRQQEVVTGTVGEQTVTLNRKGHETKFALRDLSLICPAHMLFSS